MRRTELAAVLASRRSLGLDLMRFGRAKITVLVLLDRPIDEVPIYDRALSAVEIAGLCEYGGTDKSSRRPARWHVGFMWKS
jgi:hypothetical protein